jgi:diguanylate cyclase (GGDEF)-like protein
MEISIYCNWGGILDQTTTPLPNSAAPDRVDHIKTNVHDLVRRQRWIWSSAVLITLLLTVGIASFAFPGLLESTSDNYAFNLDLALRGLIGLVLIFTVYTVYQQLQIHRLRLNLSKQIETLGHIEERTEEVYKLAVLDSLTGLYNRRSGERRLAEEISRSFRNVRPLTILLLDLDDLKAINDTFGHPAGDQVIKQFAENLQKSSRGSDVAIRLGGDEFMVVLPECKAEDVDLVLRRLERRRIEFNGRSIEIKCSAGWTDYRPGESMDSLIQRADAALYSNKRARKEQNEPIGAK